MTAQDGDVVKVDYVGSLTNGQVFDTSVKAEAEKAGMPLKPSYAPLEFTVGGGQVVKGFDSAVKGMQVGGVKTVTIQPQDAYGEANPGLRVSVERDRIQGSPEVGMVITSPTGESGRVVEVGNSSITVDFNHPLAGQVLVFKITLRDVKRD